ncbi:hypothetical protein GCM10007203_05130 [Staphylococcus nepalensis]|nr:hypothetical protein GCM10007203_05130 [Staphylococcus nepalensis]
MYNIEKTPLLNVIYNCTFDIMYKIANTVGKAIVVPISCIPLVVNAKSGINNDNGEESFNYVTNFRRYLKHIVYA